MKPRLTTAVLAAALLAALLGAYAASGAPSRPVPAAPASFFGVVPQEELSERDAEYMAAGGISSIRVPVIWSSLRPTRASGYNWGALDAAVTVSARAGMTVLPFFYGTPHWLASKPTTLPIDNGTERHAWQDYLKAAVERYGPGGQFWAENRQQAKVDYEPPLPYRPIHAWQIWNEANFFYFALPASPTRYAKLVKLSSEAIKGVDPSAKVVLTGLFAKPTASGPRGMPADRFLRTFYKVPGIKNSFDGIALHPYAVDTETLEEYVESFHEVTVENHDRVPLYITEMGWGSQNDFEKVAFEQGIQGQVRQLRGAYTYLLENRRRLDLKQVYWFSWKDNRRITICNFCDSVGLFREGRGFRPKPAWSAFLAFTGGSARP